MRQGGMPPPVLERVANQRTREDRAAQDFKCNSEKMHPYEDAYTRAGLIIAEARKAENMYKQMKSTTLPAILNLILTGEADSLPTA